MHIVLEPKQMKAVEQKAFSLGVSSLLLMEQAARAAHLKLCQLLGGVQGKRILYLVGPGNNGGDGLAMARLCHLDGGKPYILLIEEPKTSDAITNYSYTQALSISVLKWQTGFDIRNLLPIPNAVVDAVYGTGFHGSLPELLSELFSIIQQWRIPAFSVDIPSGMDGLTGKVERWAFKADHTFCLGHLKVGECLTRFPQYMGSLHILSLGIPQGAYQAIKDQAIITALEAEDLTIRLPARSSNVHKGDCGRVLLYAGSVGMAGAAGMAAQAALAVLRAGAGLVTIACEKEIIPILQTLVPNAMCLPIEQAVKKPPVYDVLAVGCGLGQSEMIWQNIRSLWDIEKASVWDADALNLLAKKPINLGEKAVLTPHPGEAARLLDESIDEVIGNPLRAAKAIQQKAGGTVVLKGAVSIIQSSTRTALNIVGSSALAKGGSGDALTGIIAALLAQDTKHETIFETVRTSCLWHGLAGMEAASQMDERSVLTIDVIECLGTVAKKY